MSIIFIPLTFIYNFVFFLQRKILIKNINKNDLVLDVGSGDKPFWRADVIVDKFLDDNQQRYSGSVIKDKRKIFIEGDVEKLPFKDKTFDFVFCAHLLEHVENPDKAIKELMRVAKSGYIEVPYMIEDLLKPFPSHLWYCAYFDEILYFLQKERDKSLIVKSVEQFGKSIYMNNIFQYLISKQTNNVFIYFYWKDRIKFKVIKAKANKYTYQYKKKQTNPIKNKTIYLKSNFLVYKLFYSLMTSFFYKNKNIKINNLIKN